MTETAGRPGNDTGRTHEKKTGADRSPGPGAAGDRGRTTIADSVAEKIAALAAREAPGIHDLGATGVGRALGGVRDRMTSDASGSTRGVHVEVGSEQAAVDLDVVIDYGVPISDIAADVRTGVITAMERMTGLEVVEVNIAVNDIDIPGDDSDDGSGGHGRVN